MDVNICAKQIDVDDDLKEKARELCARLADSFPAQKITSVRVLFTGERQWRIVELLLNGKNLTLHSAAKTTDMKASLESAVDKLETQLGRFLHKLQTQSIKPDAALKEKIWTSSDLSEQADDADLDGYEYELN
jgi:ribosomal subunit interface protein